MSETFEALVGAIYLEFERNFSRTHQWLVQHFLAKAVSDLLINPLQLEQVLFQLEDAPEPDQEAILQIQELLTAVSLSSEVGVDYRQLRNLLETKKWQEADQTTRVLMLRVAHRTEEGWLDKECIEQFPLTDLFTIDKLWLRCSQGRFGFSSQQRIWQQVNDFGQFSDRVGWRINGNWLWYKDLNFQLTAPEGHLPAIGGRGWIPNRRSLWAVHNGEPFAERLSICYQQERNF